MTKHQRIAASFALALFAWAIWTLAGLAATQVSTATGTWNIRHSATSQGTVLWHNGDDVFFHDGTSATTVQARGALEAIGDNVFGLGSGATPGRVIGLWRRGTDFAWVWTNDGTAPVEVTYTNPYNAANPMNPEAVAIADGCVFLDLQAGVNVGGNAVLVHNVFRVDRTSATTAVAVNLTDPAGTNPVVGLSSRPTTSGCQAAWVWNDTTSMTPATVKLQFWNGSTIVDVDSAASFDSNPDLSGGRIVYAKAVNGISQVFVYDSTAASPSPVALTSETDATKGHFFPRIDGRRVVWLYGNADGTNLDVRFNGGLGLAAAEVVQTSGHEFPLQFHRGQLLWRNEAGALRYLPSGTTSTTIDPAPATTVTRQWLADGFVAWLGKNAANEDRVFRHTGTTPATTPSGPPPPSFIMATAGNGQVTVAWERILGATAYNLYRAEQSGLTKDNYLTKTGGTKVTGATSPATIAGLVNQRTYYFVLTTLEGTTEGESSAEVSVTPVALQTLTVTRTGTGSGTVTSVPAGIACGADCTESYGDGTGVVLNAVAASDSTFGGWGGDADCADGVVTLTAARMCVATFTAAVPTRVARFAYVVHSSDDAIARFAVEADGRLRHTGLTFTGFYPVAVAVAPSGRFAYVVEHSGGSVSGYTIDPITGALTPIAGSPFGTLAGPWAIAIDPAERFAIVVDRNNNALTGFTVNPTTGALTTIGSVAAGFHPESIAIDPGGRFAYVANPTLSTVQAYGINATTGVLTTAGTAVATGTEPRSVTVNPTGTFLYVPNETTGNVSIFSINATTGLLTPAGSTPVVPGSGPRRLVFNASGNRALLTNAGTSALALYSADAATGGLTFVTSMATGGVTPDALAIDPTGRVVYAANSGSNEVTRAAVDASGSTLTLAGTIRTRGGPSSLALVSAASAVSYVPRFAYVGNYNGDTVTTFSLNPTTGAPTKVGTDTATGNGPLSVAVDPRSRFAYVVNQAGDTVSTFSLDPTTGAPIKVGTDTATGDEPYSVAIDPTGRFAYVSNGISDTVTTFSLNATTGAPTKVADTAAGDSPRPLAVDPTGRFAYVANHNAGTVTTFSLNLITGAPTKVGTDTAAGNVPHSVAVDPTGRFAYVANAMSNTVTTFSLNATTGAPTKVGTDTATGTEPFSVAVDPTGRFAYVANAGSDTVTTFSLNATTGAPTKVGTDTAAGDAPYFVAVDPTGRFAYVTNAISDTVTTFSLDATTGAPTKVGTDMAAGDAPLSATVVGAVAAADLSLTKADAPDPVASGQNVTYTLVVTNNGPHGADAVTLTDPLPPGTTFVSCNTSQGTCSGPAAGVNGTVTANIGTLAMSAAATVTIVATATTVVASPLTNTATVWSTAGDGTATNNAATATTTVTARADLSLTKADAPDPVVSGQTLAYTLVASNAGPDTATGVVVTDPLPAGTTFNSCTTDRGVCAGPAVGANGTVTADLGALAPGDTANIAILVTVTNVPGSLVSNTTVIAGTTVDPVAGNNTATATTAVTAPPPGCSYTLSPTGQSFPSVGGNDSVAVTTQAGCPWTASSAASWITVTAADRPSPRGTGNGTMTYTVAAHTGATSRTGTIVIAGLTFTVSQLGTSSDPTVTIVSPTADAETTATSPLITLAGTALDDVAVASVAWTNDRGGSGAAIGTTAWTAEGIPLKAGANVLTVTATDTTGNQATDVLTVTVTVFAYYLSEGATGAFFDLDICLSNPNAVAAPVSVTFLREDGTTVVQNLTLLATSRQTIRVDDVAGLSNTAVSTVVTSTSALPIVVERTMSWDANGYGAHGGNAVDGPRTRWYFAEGSQGFFDTYVLLANAGATSATVTVTFLTEAGVTVVKTYTVNPTSRLNVFTGAIPELVNTSFSIVIDSDAPIIAERAMYFGTARFWDGGHESAGVPAPATTWFHAEGATGAFFDTYILIGNPNAAPTTVTLTFLLDTGQTVTRIKTIPANSRLTVNVEAEDPLLADTAVSTTVSASLPVISERAMYWPGGVMTWLEAHDSFGTTETAVKWGLAEGRVGMAPSYETYILLANANPTQSAAVRLTFLRADGSTVVKDYTVPPTTRFNVHVNSMVPELANEPFGTVIDVTNGVALSVERAMYSNAFGVVWAAGTNALATRLP